MNGTSHGDINAGIWKEHWDSASTLKSGRINLLLINLTGVSRTCISLGRKVGITKNVGCSRQECRYSVVRCTRQMAQYTLHRSICSGKLTL